MVGAIRAELTSNTRRYLQLRDDENSHFKMVYGLGRGYLNLTSDAPELAVGQPASLPLRSGTWSEWLAAQVKALPRKDSCRCFSVTKIR